MEKLKWPDAKGKPYPVDGRSTRMAGGQQIPMTFWQVARCCRWGRIANAEDTRVMAGFVSPTGFAGDREEDWRGDRVDAWQDRLRDRLEGTAAQRHLRMTRRVE